MLYDGAYPRRHDLVEIVRTFLKSTHQAHFSTQQVCVHAERNGYHIESDPDLLRKFANDPKRGLRNELDLYRLYDFYTRSRTGRMFLRAGNSRTDHADAYFQASLAASQTQHHDVTGNWWVVHPAFLYRRAFAVRALRSETSPFDGSSAFEEYLDNIDGRQTEDPTHYRHEGLVTFHPNPHFESINTDQGIGTRKIIGDWINTFNNRARTIVGKMLGMTTHRSSYVRDVLLQREDTMPFAEMRKQTRLSAFEDITPFQQMLVRQLANNRIKERFVDDALDDLPDPEPDA